jgi:hypothetical protein
MAVHAADFRGGDTMFGIFYPTGYVLSVFPDAARADRAVAALRSTAFAPGDLVVATGPEVLAYSHEMREHPGLLARFEHFVAGLYGGEGDLADELVGLAEQGHVFVAVYAPDDPATVRAAEALRPLGPVVLRKFDALTFTDFR